MKKFLIFAVLVCAAGYGWYFYMGQGQESYVFSSQPVVTGDVTSLVSATGNVNAVETIDVGTQISGTIRELFADYNSQVKKGQLIACLDADMLEAQVLSAKANLASMRANVTKSKATLSDAERTHTRNKELFDKNALARHDLDSAETQLQIAKAVLLGAEATVAQSEASLKIAETNLQYAEISSPVDGVVINRQVDVGQTVAASLQAPTLFTIARDLTRMRVLTNVDEADIGKINEGQEVLFTVDAWPQLKFNGKVVQVRLAPQTVQNVVTYTVVLNVENHELKLRPGMTANVSIVTDHKKDVLKIPSAALRFTPPDTGAGAAQVATTSPFMPPRPTVQVQGRVAPSSSVWTVKNGELDRKITIRQGITDSGFIEILSSSPDIKAGEEVAVSWSKLSK